MTETPAIIVVGSPHYDVMVDAPHRPAKSETVTGSRWYPNFGGKGGNQAVATRAQGASVHMVSAVGTGDFAAFMLEKLRDAGIANHWVARLPDCPTGMSMAVSDAGGDYGAVIVSGADLGIDAWGLAEAKLWSGAGLLLLQNEVPEALNTAAASPARARGLRVCLNAAPARDLPPILLALTDILIVNALEAEALGGLPVPDLPAAQAAALAAAQAAAQAAALAAALALLARVPVVIVTAGGDGVALADRTGAALALPAEPVALLSTHGAGDTLVGAFCASLMAGARPEAALMVANHQDGLYVSRPQQV